MKAFYLKSMLVPCLVFLLQAASAQTYTYTWRYYRPGNTGIQGDYNESIWIDADNNPYITGYQPFAEDGGFAKFIKSENRWVNFSNVDYPVIGNPQNVGSSRISDIVQDATGKLWMGNWTGILSFNPAIGASSIQRYDNTNTVFPGGRATDVDVAPDGSLWSSVLSVTWGAGGLVRYQPQTNTWTFWGNGDNSNGWPRYAVSCDNVSVQRKKNGGYLVWIHSDAIGKMIVFDSDTQLFTELPNNGRKGDIYNLPGKTCTDAQGNLFALRFANPGEPFSLDARDVSGRWNTVPPPYTGATNDIWAFRAFGKRKILLVDGLSRTWYFNGRTWNNMGIWREGGFTYEAIMDSNNDIWVCGNGGAAIRDHITGNWQRYRVTNTCQFDYFNNDISINPNNDSVYVTANAGPGIGGMTIYDGVRWTCFNNSTYGLGYEWPFLNDNCQALTYRSSNGNVVVSPYWSYGIHEWNGTNFTELLKYTAAEKLCEDSYGRIWSIGEYYDLRYYDGSTWTKVPILAWGANIEKDLTRPGTVWACANGQVVRTDGSYRFARVISDFRELNPQSDVFTTVAAGYNNTAWVGTTGGLIKLNTDDGTYQIYTPKNSNIPGKQITPYIVSPDNRVWFTNFDGYATTNIGLYSFDGTNFVYFPVQQGGLPHAQIADMEIKIISGGYELWMSCMSMAVAVLKVEYTTPVAQHQDINTENSIAASNTLHLSIAPNPVSGTSVIQFQHTKSEMTNISIYNADGRHVKTISNAVLSAGAHTFYWDGRNNAGTILPNGIYYCVATAANSVKKIKVALIH